MVLVIPTLRCFLIVSFLSLGLILKGQGKVEADFAESNFLLRLTVSQETGSRIRLILEPVIADSFKLDTTKQFVIGWKEDVFKTALLRMHKDVWKRYKPDSLPDAFKLLDSQLQRSYSYFYLAFQEKKFEELTKIGYGLSAYDQQLYTDYLQKLADIQDTIQLLKKISRFKLQRTSGNTVNPVAPKMNNNSLVGFDQSKIPMLDKRLPALYNLLSYDTTRIKTDLSTLGLIEPLIRKTLRRIDSRRENLIHLIGDANVVSSFKSVGSTQVNAGFGLYAVRPGFSEFLGVITLAQGVEDTTREYGPSVLVPGVRRFSLMTSFRKYSIARYSSSLFFRRIGFGWDVNITPYRWINDSTPNKSVKAIPFAMNILLPYTWVYQSKPGEDYSISTDIGMSVRYIGGDLSRDQIDQFLRNGGRRWYVGPIAGINIKYNALRAQFHAPLFFVKDEKRVPGLTNGQVFASIGILANLTGDLGKVFKAKN